MKFLLALIILADFIWLLNKLEVLNDIIWEVSTLLR